MLINSDCLRTALCWIFLCFFMILIGAICCFCVSPRIDTGHHKSATTKTLHALINGMCDKRGELLPMWSMIYVMFCVFAVSLDPLFLYIFIIDQDNKCLQMDKKLSTTVLVLRSLMDIIFVALFIYIYVGVRVQMLKKLMAYVPVNTSGTVALNDFLALLPVPQLLIVVAFYNMRGTEYVKHQKVLNFFLLGQYLPRMYRIHRSSNKILKTWGIWVKAPFKFLLYILASHIVGAFWYFFSIQREISCWRSACTNHSPNPLGCMNTFFCGSRTTTLRNITFLNEHCQLDTPDDALPPFNFGIFLDSLKINNSEHIKFGKKFLYCFWWGMKNISNFGTNLTTSTNVWENFFAILISVIGLLMFLFNFEIVQTLMMKSDEMRRKIKMKKLDVRQWICINKFPDDIKNEIMKSTEQTWRINKDTNVNNPFLILPPHTQRSVKRYLFMDTLKKVNTLKDMNEKVLTLMCDYLKPVTYGENCFVLRMGDPLDFMLFIMEGTMWSYASSDSQAGNGISSMATERLRKGDLYGEELLDWALDDFSKVPVSSKHVKSQTKVEAFVLMAKDLQIVVSRHKQDCNDPGAVAVSTFRRFRTNEQRCPTPSPVEMGDDNGEILPAGN